MRFRDLRNGVEKVMDDIDGTVKMTAEQWVTLSGVFTTLATLWTDMMKTNTWVGKTDADVTVDLNDTANKVNDMSLTKAQRKAKLKAKADIDEQIAALVALKNDL